MCEINYASLFDSLDTFTGLPLIRRGRHWYGKCYIDGTPHKRRMDKVVATLKRGGGTIMMTEQGGCNGNIWQWLRDIKGMSDIEIGRLLRSESSNLPQVEYVEPETKYVDPSALNATLCGYDMVFFNFLCTMFPKEKVVEALGKYFVGSKYWSPYMDHKGGLGTCFWYITEDGLICKDKTMFFKEDGHRDKDRAPRSKFKAYYGYDRKCFFGEHLIRSCKGNIYVVESEKTAILFYLKYGEICLATGGSNCIKGVRKDWILLPDYDDAGFEWFNLEGVKVAKWWAKMGVFPEKGQDIGDFIVESFGY